MYNNAAGQHINQAQAVQLGAGLANTPADKVATLTETLTFDLDHITSVAAVLRPGSMV